MHSSACAMVFAWAIYSLRAAQISNGGVQTEITIILSLVINIYCKKMKLLILCTHQEIVPTWSPSFLGINRTCRTHGEMHTRLSCELATWNSFVFQASQASISTSGWQTCGEMDGIDRGTTMSWRKSCKDVEVLMSSPVFLKLQPLKENKCGYYRVQSREETDLQAYLHARLRLLQGVLGRERRGRYATRLCGCCIFV